MKKKDHPPEQIIAKPRNMPEAQVLVEQYRVAYNEERPHSARYKKWGQVKRKRRE